jgi:hypothetical protein
MAIAAGHDARLGTTDTARYGKALAASGVACGERLKRLRSLFHMRPTVVSPGFLPDMLFLPHA